MKTRYYLTRHPVPTRIKLLHPPSSPPSRIRWVKSFKRYGTVYTASNIPKESAERVEIVERKKQPGFWTCCGTIQTEATDGPWARQEQNMSIDQMKRWMRRNLIEMGLVAK